MKSYLLPLIIILSLGAVSCGGGSSAPPPATYTIGGTISALASSGLVLQDNGGDNLSVQSNGTFTFPTALASGSTYKVTVSVQPSSPPETCVVTLGSGTVVAEVTNVVVNCGYQEWVWQGGSTEADQMGIYGTLAKPAAGNAPGARGGAVSWTDASGNLWLFGGFGYSSAFNNNFLNDLWKYSAGEWTWMNGSSGVIQAGVYGTLGTPAPNNVPGARDDAVSWVDASGDLWLFGGFGDDSAPGTLDPLNDLWRYSAGQWTWMNGSNLANQRGAYGTLGAASSSNAPGARSRAVGWTDTAGNLWLFGGVGLDSNGALNILNDLWRYSAGEWTWMGGSNVINQAGAYGTLGTPASNNVPGARQQAVSWTDPLGNLWLFGGLGLDTNGSGGELNDLWRYGAGEWTWMGGSNAISQPGVYGTLGTPAPNNVPGARADAASWTDALGNLWIFGGFGLDTNGNSANLNDLWKYGAGEWTWMNGSNVVGQAGTYGTLGTPAPNNAPGARSNVVGWSDASGNLWLFGSGMGLDVNGNSGELNDLWIYEP